jgi:DNA repair protein RecO (recombination protein O)
MTEEIKVKAIVTRAVPYNESDIIITLVSVEKGVLTASARGCLKPKAKLRYAAEIMNFGEYRLAGKNGRYIVADCSQIESFSSITSDLDKFYAAALVLELLQKLSPNAQPALFMRALTALDALANKGADADGVVTDFMTGALEDGGCGLDFSNCAVCGCTLEGGAAFSVSDGIICRHCAPVEAERIDAASRAYIANENREIPKQLKQKANIALAQMVYCMLGARVSNHYFTEQL